MDAAGVPQDARSTRATGGSDRVREAVGQSAHSLEGHWPSGNADGKGAGGGVWRQQEHGAKWKGAHGRPNPPREDLCALLLSGNEWERMAACSVEGDW
jgi:hypothetical protein